MIRIPRDIDPLAETTEQALARVEAECGWSDIVDRFAEALAAARGGDASPEQSAHPARLLGASGAA